MNLNKNKTEVNYLSVILLRIMVSLIFIVASLNHLLNPEKAVERIKNAKLAVLGNLLGTPEISVLVSGVIMAIAGIALLIGYRTQFAAIVLITVLIPITFTIQVGQLTTLGPLFKNVAILGGLLFFVMNQKFKK